MASSLQAFSLHGLRLETFEIKKMQADKQTKVTERGLRPRSRIWVFRAFLLITLGGIAFLGWKSVQFQQSYDPLLDNPTLLALNTQLASSPTLTATATRMVIDETSTPVPTVDAEQGVVFFTAMQRGYSRLMMVPPGGLEPRELAGGAWNDRDPALSLNGDRLAFTSDRNGTWDLYVLDLTEATVRQLTDTQAYEAHPTWSPDGVWVAFESYDAGDFDIWIVPVSLDQVPIRLTINPANDTDPDWDPQGRRIAFVSDRDGSPDIFIAALDQPDDRFFNLTKTPDRVESGPRFSPDGNRLLYSADSFGVPSVLIHELEPETGQAVERGNGRDAVWSPDGEFILSILDTPQDTQLIGFSSSSDRIVHNELPVIRHVDSLSWTGEQISLNQTLLSNQSRLAAPLFEVNITTQDSAIKRIGLAPLPGVQAPNPALSDAVDEAFNALRQRTIQEMGWDFLSNLDYAFAGLNDPVPPGLGFDDWLFTGRAFSFSLSTVQAGWVEAVREEFDGQTYWRIFVRAAAQDGKLGEPLREPPWDFDARFTGSSLAYDQGGELMAGIPDGYYVDFTELARQYGFERLPALSNWRTYYIGARFNEFVLRDGLDWRSAMLELYPESALITPTPFRTPTTTPTRTPRPTPTPWWLRWYTPTPIPTDTPVPSPSPTPTP